MKKIYLFVSMLVISVFLVGCQNTPNMSELLSYQETEWEMRLQIKESQETFKVTAEKTSDHIILMFEEDERKNIGYCLDAENNISMFYEDFVIPIEKGDQLPCREWFSCFEISAAESIWHIKKENFGGIDVFVCRDGNFTIYIDCTSRMPLKIQTKTTEMDIISVG